MSDIILYEHPLNEKVRCYLRIEQLAQELEQYKHNVCADTYKPFFNTLFAISELLDRGELRKELQRDLDRHEHDLKQWLTVSEVNVERLQSLLDQINNYAQYNNPTNRALQPHHNDALLGSIKNKQALPGGGGSFDTPQLHYWLHLDMAQRLADIEHWCHPFQPSLDAIKLMLHLLRESSGFSSQIAKDGFFQSSCDQSQLLRIKLEMLQGCYPTVSGHRNRYAIRFLAWQEQPVHDIPFLLSCC